MANCAQCGRKLPPLTFGRKICQWCVQHEAAQRGEVDDVKQQVMPAPWVRNQSSITLTQVIFGANVAVFLAMAAASGTVMDFPGMTMAHYGANFGPYTLSGDWWRLVTYMFLHGGLMHIAFNMWCLWDLGALCESLYGRWSFAAIYLTTGFAAGVASVAWNPRVLSVGASGAIFGLAGALIASFYLGEFSLPSIAIRGTLRSLVFFVGFNVLFGSMFPGIDNAAHFGGLISGLILGALIARVAPQHDNPLRRASILGIVALAVAAGALGVQHWRGAPFRIGRALESLSESPDRAIAQLRTVVRQEPNSVHAHFALGQAYFNANNFPQAEAEFTRVIELQPQHTAARFNLGMVYLNEKRPGDAKTTFTQMLSQNANDADAHYGIGLALADEEKYQAAIEEFKTALRLAPRGSGVYYELGQCYARLGMYDDAIAAYLNEKEKSGDDPDLETALADAYQAKGMTQQAQEARNRAGQLKSGRRK